MTATAADASGGVKSPPPASKTPKFAVDPTHAELLRIPLAQLHESPLNPREHYDAAALNELVASLLQTGQLTPIIVRPRKAGGYEIAAGHRRYRAAVQACKQQPQGASYRRLSELEAKVVSLDDRAFIEVLNIENLQRDDLHPMEEARGFRDLMEKAGYDVAKIAARIGRSTRYVYDSLTLLKLTPAAKKLFLAGEFERGHAIILARLNPEWQARAIERGEVENFRIGGLFTPEHFDGPPAAELDLEDEVKPVSVREFQSWVDDHVRQPEKAIDPVLFPETAQLLQQAAEEEEKVVHITHDYRVGDDARDEKQRTYGEHAWKRADGKAKSKSCDYSVIGVVVAGPGRGEAYRVCVRKDKCKVHWAAEQRQLAADRKYRGQSQGGAKERESAEAAEQRWRRQQAENETERARWEKAQPAILKAVAAKIASAPVGPTSGIAQDVLAACTDGKPNNAVPRGRTLEQVVRHAAFQLYATDVKRLHPGYYAHAEAVKNLRALGIDAAKIVDHVAPKQKPEKPAAKTPAKKKAKRG